VSIGEVFVHGPGLQRHVLSAESSTPKARAFVDALLNSSAFSGVDYMITSREVRSLPGAVACHQLRPVEPGPSLASERPSGGGRKHRAGGCGRRGCRADRRRVAAAVQLAIFPVWLGAALDDCRCRSRRLCHPALWLWPRLGIARQPRQSRLGLRFLSGNLRSGLAGFAQRDRPRWPPAEDPWAAGIAGRCGLRDGSPRP
jgi:hypothetical protein